MKKSFRLLLVEDDSEDVLLFRKHLPPNYEVAAVSGPTEVRGQLQAAPFDVLFIDYRLGADDGLSLVRALASEGITQPMVMMTGGDIEGIGENALLAGATDFLAKADLSPATIERATRWAMVRKVVELRRQAANPRFELDELLSLNANVPVPKDEGHAGKAMRRVMYLSRMTDPMTPQQFANLCALAAARNQSMGITGVLANVGDFFLQCIEGPEDGIEELMVKISRDVRHQDLVIVADQPINRRDFGVWNMGTFSIRRSRSDAGSTWLKRIQEVRESARSHGSGKEGFAAGVRLLAK